MSIDTQNKKIPLCVDLDGTLIATDTLWEGVVKMLSANLFSVFSILIWVFAGKASLKENVARSTNLNVKTLPVNTQFLTFLKNEKANGRYLVLVTGAAKSIAQSVAQHFDLFDEVLSSDHEINLTSKTKRDLLVSKFGERGFDYAGNSSDDVCVFDVAHKAYVVAGDRAAMAWYKKNNGQLFEERKSTFKVVLKTLRVHQWLKNVLLGAPMVLNHTIFNLSTWIDLMIAFFSFSLVASSVYVLNDLADIENDRAHLKKRFRSIASGAITIPGAIFVGLACFAIGVGLAFSLSLEFVAVLFGYFVVTTAYTFVLKRKLLVDVFTLAFLYTVRLIAGAVALSVSLSFWLLAFSIFFFLSLALVKRYVELLGVVGNEDEKSAGRGYYGLDRDMVAQAGIASAFSSALVLALYIESAGVRELYNTPYLLWPLCPLVLYLVLRIWMLARRGHMEDDPVVFIIKDWRSQFATLIGTALILMAAL